MSDETALAKVTPLPKVLLVREARSLADWEETPRVFSDEELERLIESPDIDARPCWSVDGTRIVFNREREGSTEILIAELGCFESVEIQNQRDYGNEAERRDQH